MSNVNGNGKGMLFEYAVLYHPKQTKEEHDRGEQPKSVLLIPATPILAGSEDEVAIIAARNIPDDHLKHLEDVETVVRPF